MRKSRNNLRKNINSRKSRNNLRKNSDFLRSRNNRQGIVRRSKNGRIIGGNPNLIHVLYVLGNKNQTNHVQAIAMSKSIKNLHMFAKDLPDNLTYQDSRNQAILESNMAVDTIELNNPNTSHDWSNVSFKDIDTKISSGVYGNLDDISETLLHYNLDKSSDITGVIGSVYSNEVPESDGQMMTEFGNFNDALTLLDNYEPMELKVNVLDHNISVDNVSREAQQHVDSDVSKSELSNEAPKSSGKPTTLYVLYVLAQKNNPNQVQLVAISQSLKNIHKFASDLPENLLYPASKSGGIFNEFKQALENNMVIDTIDYTNRNDSHNWQKVNLGDIDRMRESGEYDDNIDPIDEITLYYTLDNSSPIPGVVDSININLFRDSDSEIELKTEFGNFRNAIELLNNYDPMDLEIDVADNNLEIKKIQAPSSSCPLNFDEFNKRFIGENNVLKVEELRNSGCSLNNIISEEIFMDVNTSAYIKRQLIEYLGLKNALKMVGLKGVVFTIYHSRDRSLGLLGPVEIPSKITYRDLINERISVKDIITAGYPYIKFPDFLRGGITPQEIIAAGFPFRCFVDGCDMYRQYVSPKLLKETGGYTAKELYRFYKIKELLEDNAFTLRELIESHIPLEDIIASGVKELDFKQIGLSPLELYKAGYGVKELLKSYTMPELIEGGLTFKELQKEISALRPYFNLLNLKVSDLIEQGYKDQLTYYFNVKELYDSGMTINEIKESYYPGKDKSAEFYSDDRWILPALAKFLKPKQLEEDYFFKELAKYYTPKQLYEDGYSIQELTNLYGEFIIQKLSTFMTAQQIWDAADEIAKDNNWYIDNKSKDILVAVNRNPEVIRNDLINWFSPEEISKINRTNKLPLDKNTIHSVRTGKIPNVSLKDHILEYRDRIPELLKEFTPEYLFQTGLFSYGDLKPYIKGRKSKMYLEATKDCKKNWKRQTNLDCKFIPDTFPNPGFTINKGRTVNETERYKQ